MPGDAHREYWEQRLGSGPSLDTVGWLSLGRAFNRGMYRVRAVTFKRRVLRAMRRAQIDPLAASVLDIGSGSGFYIDLWKTIGARSITGWDITDAVVSALSKKYPGVRFNRADIGDELAPPAGAQFDAISCMDVLFHIIEDDKYERAFKNMAALLKPGGLLIVTENCLHGKRIDAAHQVSRTLAETQNALQSAGLEIVERRPAFVLLNTPVDSRSRLLHLQWETAKRIASRSETAGAIIAAGLYPLELLLTEVLREGPSTEMLICRKR